MEENSELEHPEYYHPSRLPGHCHQELQGAYLLPFEKLQLVGPS